MPWRSGPPTWSAFTPRGVASLPSTIWGGGHLSQRLGHTIPFSSNRHTSRRPAGPSPDKPWNPLPTISHAPSGRTVLQLSRAPGHWLGPAPLGLSLRGQSLSITVVERPPHPPLPNASLRFGGFLSAIFTPLSEAPMGQMAHGD
ncbi:hypothetical protein SODALDRAFT_362232 [Sodiomyces alkalinus F11]|uniref:Uncharacterized protein n=1 Tax=Sodiomyces alkalinus (strain CBS 110278 / VKM F-3762 / F11) TaxID=1314773 RepID=A0A3N2PPY5_SODAK|nr:hypothetical protein SODALDRAFT_362232 [Sodiomyces alkalinus F11]ROT36426.1 hypothetical protein SODALDRAFT_362232 [Sodiomyces alkalinus F11]